MTEGTLVRNLSPEQWRVLNALFDFSRHTVRPRLTAIHKTQDAGYDDIDELYESRLIDVRFDDTDLSPEVGLHKVGNAARRHMRLRLSRSGLARVLDDPLNQIRCTLAQHSRPIPLVKLYRHDNTTVIDDLVKAQHAGQITVTFCGEEVELTPRVVLFGELHDVALTARGREYLPL